MVKTTVLWLNGLVVKKYLKPKYLLSVVAVLIFLLLTSYQSKPELSPSPETNESVITSDENNLFEVARVLDGDTIELLDGRKVRYIGINSPEPTKNTCFGKESTNKNKELVEGKMVRLEKDISDTDKYGRLLRYVYVEDLLINDVLVREGYAKISTYPPDVKFQEQFKESERQARENLKGFWSSCQK